MHLNNILNSNKPLIGQIVDIKSKQTSVYIILVEGRKLTAYSPIELKIGDYVALIKDSNTGNNHFKLEKLSSGKI